MQKLYYSIREVSEIVDEEQHVLRYWEKEFPMLKPKKNKGGNRVYSQKDVDFVLALKKMLREDLVSLKDAKLKMLDYSENIKSEPIKFVKQSPKPIEEKTPLPKVESINFDLEKAPKVVENIQIIDFLKQVSAFLRSY